METLRDLWNKTCMSANIPAISMDTCARILAVVYVHGNNESFVYNKSFLSDLQYVKERYRLQGGEIPNADFCELVKKYVAKLESYIEDHKSDNCDNSAIFKSHIPNWAAELFYDRYKIKLIN